MSGNLSGLPPSAIARLNAVADMQSVIVKIVNLPNGLQNLPSPLKLTGTVAGQNPDGSVQVQTDKGIINLMLKDRQPLPPGLRLEIDLPAGRAPQQASIRHAPEAASPPGPATAPSLAAALAQNPLSSATAAAGLKLDRASTLKATEIEDALRATSPKLADMVAALKAPPAPLQAGQSVRLIPLQPGQGNAIAIQPGQIAALPAEALLAALTKIIQDLPADQQVIKAQLVTLLARMDLSSLQLPSQVKGSPSALPPQIQALLSHLEQQVSSDGKISLNTITSNSIRYEPTIPFSPAKPVDIQVAAFTTIAVKPGVPAPLIPGQLQVQQLPLTGALPSPATAAFSLPAGPTPPVSPAPPPNQPLVIPAQTLPSQAVPLPPQILPAQVTGFTKENLPVISFTIPGNPTPVSYVAQFQTSNLQIGSPLLISVLPESATGAPPLSLSSWMQPGQWDSLTDLIQTLHQVNPAMAQSLTQILPQPNQPQNMGGLALFFLSVLRSGDVESWMTPQVANLLRLAGKGETLRAITSDIALTGRSENLVLAQDWKATMFPVYHDQNVHRVPLYYKRQDEEDGDDHKERRAKLMRFLFDLKLARMGNVQIDGFMQPERLDMIVRTRSPLSVPMQRTMQGLYTQAMDKSNLHGELTFQFKPEHWVSIDIPVTKEEMGVSA